MARGEPAGPEFVFPRPGPALRVVLGLVFALWLGFALALNWGGASGSWFELLAAAPDRIFSFEVWRPFTAGLIHHPRSSSHILGALLGLYFLGTSLESEWGSARYVRFLVSASALSYFTQALVALVLPASIKPLLVPELPLGAMPAVMATSIAWATTFRNRTIYLMMVLPVNARWVPVIFLVLSMMGLIAGEVSPSGHVALFAGMGYGYLLGGGTPSPLRRLYLKYRLNRLEAEVKAERTSRAKTAKGKGLRVIEGGGGKNDRRMLH